VSFIPRRPSVKTSAICRLVAFSGVGHLPYEEAPQEFNRALIEFLTAM